MIFAGLSQHLLPVLSQQGQDHMELEVVRLLMYTHSIRHAISRSHCERQLLCCEQAPESCKKCGAAEVTTILADLTDPKEAQRLGEVNF